MNFKFLCVVSSLIFALQKNFTSFGTKSLDRCQPAAPVESQHAHPRSSDDYLLLFTVYVWSFFFYVFIIFMVIIHSNFFKNNIKQCKVFFFCFTRHFQRRRCLPIWLRVNTAEASAKADSKEYAAAPKSALMGLFRCKGFPRDSDSVYSLDSAFAKGAIISTSRAAFLICGGAEMQEWPFFFFF